MSDKRLHVPSLSGSSLVNHVSLMLHQYQSITDLTSNTDPHGIIISWSLQGYISRLIIQNPYLFALIYCIGGTVQADSIDHNFSLQVLPSGLSLYSSTHEGLWAIPPSGLPPGVMHVTFRGFGPSQQRTITFNSKIYSRNPRSYIKHIPSRGITTNVYIYNTIIAQLIIIVSPAPEISPAPVSSPALAELSAQDP